MRRIRVAHPTVALFASSLSDRVVESFHRDHIVGTGCYAALGLLVGEGEYVIPMSLMSPWICR